MLKAELLTVKEAVLDFDVVDFPTMQLWFFLTPKRLLVRKGMIAGGMLNLQEQLVLECYPGMAADGPSNQKLLIIPTAADALVLISCSQYSLIRFSLLDLKAVVLNSHIAPVTDMVHVSSHFAYTTSEDHSIAGWDVDRCNLIFKFSFMYHSPCCILASVALAHPGVLAQKQDDLHGWC